MIMGITNEKKLDLSTRLVNIANDFSDFVNMECKMKFQEEKMMYYRNYHNLERMKMRVLIKSKVI